MDPKRLRKRFQAEITRKGAFLGGVAMGFGRLVSEERQGPQLRPQGSPVPYTAWSVSATSDCWTSEPQVLRPYGSLGPWPMGQPFE